MKQIPKKPESTCYQGIPVELRCRAGDFHRNLMKDFMETSYAGTARGRLVVDLAELLGLLNIMLVPVHIFIRGYGGTAKSMFSTLRHNVGGGGHFYVSPTVFFKPYEFCVQSGQFANARTDIKNCRFANRAPPGVPEQAPSRAPGRAPSRAPSSAPSQAPGARQSAEPSVESSAESGRQAGAERAPSGRRAGAERAPSRAGAERAPSRRRAGAERAPSGRRAGAEGAPSRRSAFKDRRKGASLWGFVVGPCCWSSWQKRLQRTMERGFVVGRRCGPSRRKRLHRTQKGASLWGLVVGLRGESAPWGSLGSKTQKRNRREGGHPIHTRDHYHKNAKTQSTQKPKHAKEERGATQ